jgi:hypothetical protein
LQIHKKIFFLILFIISNNRLSALENQKSLRKNLTVLLKNKKIVSFIAASLCLLFTILIRNYLQRPNKKKFKEKEQTLNKKASKKKII